MNSKTTVAKRYAKALFAAAHGHGKVQQVREELAMLVGAIEQNKDFRDVFEHPNMQREAKLKLVKDVFVDHISELVYNTLQLMITKRRENILSALLEYYVQISNRETGQAQATIFTPFALSETEQDKMISQFEQLTNQKIAATSVIKPGLLGGFQVKIGDRLYDASMSGKLNRLQKSMQQAQSL
jgi:F-type H+-transporting ATPase subunit delta